MRDNDTDTQDYKEGGVDTPLEIARIADLQRSHPELSWLLPLMSSLLAFLDTVKCEGHKGTKTGKKGAPEKLGNYLRLNMSELWTSRLVIAFKPGYAISFETLVMKYVWYASR